jgi:hypothetical protein
MLTHQIQRGLVTALKLQIQSLAIYFIKKNQIKYSHVYGKRQLALAERANRVPYHARKVLMPLLLIMLQTRVLWEEELLQTAQLFAKIKFQDQPPQESSFGKKNVNLAVTLDTARANINSYNILFF